MGRILLIISLMLSLLYAGDYLSAKYRIPKNRDPFETVEVRRYYAVGMKDKRTEFMFLTPESQVCVRSLFPHFGYNPCWYVRRHRVKEIDL